MSYLVIREHTNASCIKCNCVDEEMNRIGCIVMCHKCTDKEFPNAVVERSSYLKWLKKYNEKF